MQENQEQQILFSDLWLSKDMVLSVEKKWYKNPTSIQEKVIPVFLNTKKDIIWQAQTWTWKTAAFALPLLEKINEKDRSTQAIILTPTRELAIQVAEEFKSFSWFKNLNISLLYWWQFIWKELKELRSWAQIVIWTPWRVQDHLRKKSLKIDTISYFILDEADEMLNIWFREEIDNILENAPNQKRVLLFSATMPKAIKDIVHNYMWEYELLSVKREEITNKNIEQKCYKVNESNKFDALWRVIDIEKDFYGIIFCKTKSWVDEVASSLMWKWYLAEWIHGDVEQKWREKVLNRFKTKKINILVATDVAARWIDVNDLTHVVNYDLPDNPETYTHRIWRTWRAGKKWVAISFVSRRDSRMLIYIERIIKEKIKVEKLPEAKEIIERKQERLIDETSKWLDKENLENYKTLAKKLLELWNAEDVLAAILEGAYWNVFNEASYNDIKEVSIWTTSWKTRLFIARWRNHWLDVIWVKKLIEAETGLDLRWVRDVALFDEFSFMNLNSADAEVILATFKRLNKQKPLVVQAKERWWSSWSFRWNYNSRGSWWFSQNRWWYRRDWELTPRRWDNRPFKGRR